MLERASGRIECLEQPVVHGDVGVREGIQQRRLADVRVTRQRHSRRLSALTFLPPHLALLAQILQPPPQERDPSPGDAAVGLELRLTGPARPDSRAERAHAAAEALEVLPHAAHPWEVVLELRQLDLKLALGAPRMLGEDVEDQLRPVDDARLECILERPLLGRLELVVHEQHLGAGLLVGVLQLLELPLAQVGPPLRAGAVLDELPDRLDERVSASSRSSASSASESIPWASTATMNPRSSAGSGWRWVTDGLCRQLGRIPTMAPVQLSPALTATGHVSVREARRGEAAACRSREWR